MSGDTGEFLLNVDLEGLVQPPKSNVAMQQSLAARRKIKQGLTLATGRRGFDPYNSTASRNGNASLDRNSAWARVRKR